FGCIIGVCIKEYQKMRSAGLIPEPLPLRHRSCGQDAPPCVESQLRTPPSEQPQSLSMFYSPSPPDDPSPSPKQPQSVPMFDSSSPPDHPSPSPKQPQSLPMFDSSSPPDDSS